MRERRRMRIVSVMDDARRKVEPRPQPPKDPKTQPPPTEKKREHAPPVPEHPDRTPVAGP